MSGSQSDAFRVFEVCGLRLVDEWEYLLGELVVWNISLCGRRVGEGLTEISCLLGNFCYSFKKVGEVIAEELGADNNALSCVRREDCSAEEF